MEVVLHVTSGLLVVAAVLVAVRLLRGPTVYDRLVALDTLLVVIVMGVAVESAKTGDVTSVLLLVLFALVGFVGTVAVTRLVPEEHL